MPQPIKFGTDGWRGVIADDYTFENVRRVANAIAHYIHKHEDATKGLVIGYDTRFGSRRFAETTAEVIAATGIDILLADDYTPTPALSYAVKNLGKAGGVMITSSHNPASWNGVKFKGKYGGSGTPEMMRLIEGYLDQPVIKVSRAGTIKPMDFKAAYVPAICKFVDLDKIARANFKFVIDPMYGAGRGVLAGIFRQHGINFVEIRSDANPLFPGINPEPILPHVKGCQDAVVSEKAHAGLITDGDADRIGAVAEDGSYVDAHKCYGVMLEWLLKRKDWSGAVTRAFNTTRMLDRIAKKYGRELIEHGIGFKFVCDVVLSGKEVLIGGEESGGIGIPRFLPERDGILNSLFLAAIMADEGKPLGQLVQDLQKEYGEHYYGRRDMRLTDEIKQSALRRAAARPAGIGRYKVKSVEDLDGIKFFLDAPTNGGGADAWVLIRGSGTEPLLRVYCEASSPELVNRILDDAEAFVYEKATVA